MMYRFKVLIALSGLSVSMWAQAAPEPDRTALPIEPAPFAGKIAPSYKDAQSDFPQPIKAPAGAPNVVLILLDDIGFGQAGTFGGPIPTPNLDRLARRGIIYNAFHTTGICSPTRAALLTGRNHHQVGYGSITELATGFPGYDTMWPRSAASVAEILRLNGYSTSAFGKWHNTPDWETSTIGPFDRWPTSLGFETFYGFHGGESSQYEPQMFRNTTPVEPATRPEQGYHMNQDLVDHTIHWIHQQRSISPNKPFFSYVAPGAVHAPLHAPKEWVNRFKGQFDQGWDQVREDTLARQKQLGMVPANTKLTARPAEIPAWDSLSPEQKRLYARHMEVFAGFVAYTDAEMGRLLDAIEQLPDADNTMIIYVVGDNGPSAEGSPTGTSNNMMTQNGIADSVEAQLKIIDELGGPLHENHYPVGWAWSGSAPFQWMKRVPSHFGGTRNGMVIVWPAGIKNVGALRGQFHHVIDIEPTILEVAKLPQPKTVNGARQTPITGISMAYTFNDAQAKDRRTVQYFEVGGHRAIYKDGWVAAARHGLPWKLTASYPTEQDVWELYDVRSDFSQSTDLAAKYPEKLKTLKQVFEDEARKNNVYPLDDRFVERALSQERPSFIRGRTSFSYAEGTVRIPEGNAPPIYQRSHRIDAQLDLPANGKVQGVIVACGGSMGGYSLFVEDGKLVYEYNFFNKKRFRVESKAPLPSGKVKVSMVYEQQPFAFLKEATGGPAKLYVNDQLVGEAEVALVVPARFSATETLDIGVDLGSAVSKSYVGREPFKFTGRIEKVDFALSSTRPVKP
ncbi:arylsulfatase [Ottowia sp.]|uniref:arylsulfatase n=1 Tax=Ottowia sp. TaxID=1898956 RepID=UPI003A8B7AB4